MKSFYSTNKKCKALRKTTAKPGNECELEEDQNNSNSSELDLLPTNNTDCEITVEDGGLSSCSGSGSENDENSSLETGSDTEWVNEEQVNQQQEKEEALKSKFSDQLNSSNLKAHLASTVGGNKGSKAISTLISRVAKILSWLHNLWGKQSTTIHKLVKQLLRINYEVIADFITHLRDTMCLQASTALAYLEDFLKYLKWYVLFRGRRNKPGGLVMADMLGVEDVIKNVRRECRKERKRRGALSKDIPTLKKLSLWPPGGMHQLSETVHNELEWIERINEETYIDKSFYSSFTKVMCASMYLSPQGRIQAVEDIRNGQIDELRDKRFVLSRLFKTQSKYGYQPVTAGETFLKIFDKYIRFVRPNILQGSLDFVFIDIEGNQLDLGRKLISFFEIKLGLHITSTTIRSLVETEVNELRQEGKISQVERESIMNVNGHSSQIVTDYYVRQDREKDVGNAFNVFDVMNDSIATFSPLADRAEQSKKRNNEMTENDFQIHLKRRSVQAETSVLASPVTTILDQTEHTTTIETDDVLATTSNIHTSQDAVDKMSSPNPMRVKWTEQEIDYVGKWCTKTLRDNPSNSNNIVARCLTHIRNEPAALRLFHKNHILNSGRLRHGYEAYRDLHTSDE